MVAKHTHIPHENFPNAQPPVLDHHALVRVLCAYAVSSPNALWGHLHVQRLEIPGKLSVAG